MITALVTAKRAGLVKTSRPVVQMDARIERARQLFNAALKRAESDYHERVRRAVNAVAIPETEVETADHDTDAPAQTVNEATT